MNQKRLLYQTLLSVILLMGLSACTNSPSAEVNLTVFPTVTEISATTPTVTPPRSPTAHPLSVDAPILRGDYAIMSPAEMRADLEQLFVILENTHPNLYAKRSRAEVELERQQINNGFEQSLTDVEFFRVVAPLVASLGDYHTQVLLSTKVQEQMAASEIIFPLGVVFDGQRAFIIENYSENEAINLGAELLAINDTSIADIQNHPLYQRLPGYPFEFTLWLMYGSIPDYQVQVLLPNETTPVILTIPGMSLAAINHAAENSSTDEPRPPLSYEKLAGEQIGLLTINNFWEITPLLKPAFSQIQADEIEHLIIDIRANTGGEYGQVDLLMRYLTAKPYRQCSSRYYAPPAGDLSAGPQAAECNLQEPSPTPLRFLGKMYLLIGPDTFSAAITLATILQDYDLALLIGEETSDTASYCAWADEPQIFSMHLSYRCSSRCFIRPSGVQGGDGVIPDILVETTVQDELAGRDPVLDYTLEMTANGTTP